MTCEEFIGHLLDFVEEDLDDETHRLCRQHAELCKECAGYLSSYRVSTALGKAVFSLDQRPEGDSEESYELPEALVQSILAEARRLS